MHETCHINIRKKAFSCYKCGTGGRINGFKREAAPCKLRKRRSKVFLKSLKVPCVRSLRQHPIKSVYGQIMK